MMYRSLIQAQNFWGGCRPISAAAAILKAKSKNWQRDAIRRLRNIDSKEDKVRPHLGEPFAYLDYHISPRVKGGPAYFAVHSAVPH
jgi:hypothetical protein